jgi:hypothetical protein
MAIYPQGLMSFMESEQCKVENLRSFLVRTISLLEMMIVGYNSYLTKAVIGT